MFKILVAEDDAELRQLFCRVLTRHGFQPIGAADGVEALHKTENPQQHGVAQIFGQI